MIVATSSSTPTYICGDASPGVGDALTWNRANKLYLTQSVNEVNDGSAMLVGDNEGACVLLTNDGIGSQWTCTVAVYLTENDEDTITLVGPFNVLRWTYASLWEEQVSMRVSQDGWNRPCRAFWKMARLSRTTTTLSRLQLNYDQR